jgi:hypothetical protein
MAKKRWRRSLVRTVRSRYGAAGAAIPEELWLRWEDGAVSDPVRDAHEVACGGLGGWEAGALWRGEGCLFYRLTREEICGILA